MNMQVIKSTLTPKVLVSVGTLLAMIISSVIIIDSRYAHAEDVERTTAQIALDAQGSLVQFRLDMANQEIRKLKKIRKRSGSLDVEDIEDLQDLRDTKKYLNNRKDIIMDQQRSLQKDL